MVVKLPQELTIARAAELKASLLSALASSEPVELDGREVAEVDVSGLQILFAAGRSARARGLTLTFVAAGRSAALEDAIQLAGLAHRDGRCPGEGDAP